MFIAKVAIIGAGPAGAAAALQLSRLGIDCIVVDKAVFPRDKICGDGLSGKVINCLHRIDPEIAIRLEQASFKLNSKGLSFVSPNQQHLNVCFRSDVETPGSFPKREAAGYVCKRLDFDNFMVAEMRRCPNIRLMEGVTIDEYILEPDGYRISGNDGFELKCDLLLVANGAYSSFTKEIAKIRLEPKHYVAGIRAYYEQVSSTDAGNYIELHFVKKLLPGYFWISPLPNGAANVGVAMRSDAVRRKKMNLKKELQEIIDNDPVISARFKNATLSGPMDEYGLPLGSKQRCISGERYLLIGDAAFLIDPFTGEGVGNALYSGYIAANQAAKSLQTNDFSAKALAAYDKEVNRVMGPELRLSHRLQRLIHYPRLVNLLVKISIRNKQLKELLSCKFFGVELRKKLATPSFYFKLLLNR
jgi:geranylgeranyl reductase family protein